jgi:cyclophilin family peptidyl-prolyl cis-trans isomerase
VLLKTNKGDIVIELFENEAPKTVGNFVSLVENGFYNGLTFHRVLPGFMAQGGCPDGNGMGGPGYTIPCECNQPNYRRHFRGTLSMAHAGPNTGGSQFFLTFIPTSGLDGKHTAFGRVVDGMDVLAKIQRRDPSPQTPRPLPTPDSIIEAKVLRKRPHDYKPTKMGE